MAVKSNREVVVVSGVRTPMGKMGGVLEGFSAVELGMHTVRELLLTSHSNTFTRRKQYHDA